MSPAPTIGELRDLGPGYRKEPDNGATPPPGKRVPIVLLAGAIKWWWQTTCLDCGHWDDAEIMRSHGPACLSKTLRLPSLYVWWNSPEHRQYVAWRDKVRQALIDAGYLTYAPYMAFKGPWDERAQAINNAVIDVADAMVVLSPDYAITEGTDWERERCERRSVPVIDAPPPKGKGAERVALLKLIVTLEALRR
jgi:hypothetical protein